MPSKPKPSGTKPKVSGKSSFNFGANKRRSGNVPACAAAVGKAAAADD